VWEPNPPQCVDVYAAITGFGVTHVHVVAGTSQYSCPHTTEQGKPPDNITPGEYKEVLKATLLRGGQNMVFAQAISKCFLHQDNDPTHKFVMAA